MSGTTPRRYSLREEKRRIQRENPPVEIVLDDDDTEYPKGKKPEPRVITIPATATWSDELILRSNREPVAVAQQLVGDAELYAEFVRQGGSATTLFRIAGQEDQGASVGESPSSTDS